MEPGSGDVEVDITELIMEERQNMECKQELDRVERLNKVTHTIRHSISTKLERNILTKLTTGPLGIKHSVPPTIPKEPEVHHQRLNSEEIPYHERQALMESIKASQNDELDTLRRRGLVQKRIADRRMRSRANRMFNQRVYVNPKSTKAQGKSSILVTGIEEGEAQEAKTVEFIRQESQMFIDSFFRTPSKNRRVLQRLNSSQLSGIKASEMRKTNLRMFQQLPFDQGDGDLSYRMLQGAHRITSPQNEIVPETLPQNSTPSDNVNFLELNQPTRDTASGAGISSAPKTKSLKKKLHNTLSKIPEATNKFLSRKKKGGISKSAKKRKAKKGHFSSSSLDERDDIRVKQQKKSLERRRYLFSSRKLKSKALNDDQAGNVISYEQSRKRAGAPSPPAVYAQRVLPPPVDMTDGWPPLSPKSHDSHMTSHTPVFKKSYSMSVQSFDEALSGGPPYPDTSTQSTSLSGVSTRYQQGMKCLSSGEPKNDAVVQSVNGHVTNGFAPLESHDDHVTVPPMTTLKEIEQVEEDGYESESESGTFSDDGTVNVLDEPRVSGVTRVGVVGSRVHTNGVTEPQREDSPHLSNEDRDEECLREEEGDHVSDLPSHRKKSRSQEEPTHPSHTSHYRRHYSSPQIFRQSSRTSPLHHLYCSSSTPHGYYATANIEVNPFAADFQQGVEESLSLAREDVQKETTVATATYSRDAVETIEMTTRVKHMQATTLQGERNEYCGMEPGHNPLLESRDGIPPQAFQDPGFVHYVKTLDHKATKSDYITYKLRTIGDAIDQQYDDKLNHALDIIFMEVVKNSVSWESFSSISKRLLLEGQRIQDGIMLVTCFGRRVAEMVPRVGDTVGLFTQQVVDAYASDLLLSIGGWGRLVESYNQVETTIQDYECDYSDYRDATAFDVYGDTHEHLPIPDTQPPVSTNGPLPTPPTQSHLHPSTNNPMTTTPPHPNIIHVNPPPVCQVTFDPHSFSHQLRRVMSVEVLFTEGDTTEHSWDNHHDNKPRPLKRSLSASSIETASFSQKRLFSTDYLTPSPMKHVPEAFRYEETVFEESTFQYSRRGSVASVCSTASAIRLVTNDHYGDEQPVIVSKGNGHILEIPDGQYLDLSFDTPAPSRSNTLDGRHRDQSRNIAGRQPVSRWPSLTLTLVGVAVVVGVVGALGVIFMKRKK